MEVSLINIGNSRGIRLSKSIIDQYKLKDKIELVLEKNRIIIKPVSSPRKGWDKAFKEMHESGDDKLLLPDVFEDEELEDW
ncbi:MAG: AbrB/MazE/SpoVT family DNA-binding domain-containing protein [Candidatus Kapaibacteriales bacterium]